MHYLTFLPIFGSYDTKKYEKTVRKEDGASVWTRLYVLLRCIRRQKTASDGEISRFEEEGGLYFLGI
jgi:hypothetical protein